MPILSRRAAAALVLASLLAGCTSFRVETRPLPQVLDAEQPSVVRVTLGDNRVMELFQPSVADDSLRGHPTATAVRRLSFPLASVQSYSVRRFNIGRTLLMVAGIAGGVFVYDQIQRLNTTP
jgi:hypothetical protein